MLYHPPSACNTETPERANMPRISGPHPLARVLALLISAAFSFAQPTVAQQRGAATLRVIVSDADGPVNGAVVEVKLNGPTVATAVTNVAGEAEFTTLAPANYQVTVSKESFEPLTASNIIMTAGAQVE